MTWSRHRHGVERPRKLRFELPLSSFTFTFAIDDYGGGIKSFWIVPLNLPPAILNDETFTHPLHQSLTHRLPITSRKDDDDERG